MNKVNLIGRLTKDIEIKYNDANIAFARFTLAVNRSFTNAEGQREADFISCVAWRKTAEVINKNFKKGSEFAITGRIQTGSYDKPNGEKAYTTDVIVEEITFVGKKEERPAPEYVGPQEIQPVEENDPFKDFGEEIILSSDDLPF